MRIAMLTNNYKPFVGGVPISIERLSQGLRELGHTVYIFAPSYEDQREEPFVIRYRSRKKKLKGEFIVPDMFDPIIKESFAQIPFDLIHVHQPMLMGYMAHYLGRKYEIPVVYTYHTRYEQYLHYLKPYEALQNYAHKAKLKPVRLLENFILEDCSHRLLTTHNRIFMNQCDMIFAPSQSMKNYIEDLGISAPVEILPTGLAEEDFTYEPERTSEIRNIYLQDKKFLFCTVSRLEPEKNLEFLLQGLVELKEQVGDCFRTLIIGDGSQKQELIEKTKEWNLEDNIQFCGRISHHEIRNYYHACDLFLFASCSETQGIVLLEAMAAGLPVVAVSASGVDDVVHDGVNGFRTPQDLQLWSGRIKHLMMQNKIRAGMKDKALQEARQYLAANVALQAQRCYHKVIEQPRMIAHYEEDII